MADSSTTPPDGRPDPSGDETVSIPARKYTLAHSGGTDFRHGRFQPGERLGSRYRIVARLGKGGMGEVYRADDLELGQSVALKFLPERVVADESWLRRFRNEVRTARQVAHPNVCRIYDIGQEDGHVFLTMEYVEGEDLSGVLRRLGRPSPEKAIEIARQICLGLAAAHDAKILHRDLKPANIMIDDRGRVRITDFGLAGFLDELDGIEARAGTPAYMAPEQLADGAVSVRSDIYALGLVLHKLFTGERVFDTNDVKELKRRRSNASITKLSSQSEGIDQSVARVIERCLEEDPGQRPMSVYQVLAALPGGDPLAAALAAGDTPSPQMLAEAGETGGLNHSVAVALLVAFVGFALLSMWLVDQNAPVNQLPREKPPAVLRDRALTILHDFGYTKPPGDIAGWFAYDLAPAVHVARHIDRPDPWAPLKGADLPLLRFELRTSPDQMVRLSWSPQISWTRPPFEQPGMTRLTLDSRGNLLRFEAVPGEHTDGASASGGAASMSGAETDWTTMFDAAGLDVSGFTPIDPDFVPTVHCDHLSAWSGAWPGAPQIPLDVHAGLQNGRLVYMQLKAPWHVSGGQRGGFEPLPLIAAVIVGLALLLMMRNLRTGRADRVGAFRLALFVFAITMARWLCTAHHVESMKEFDLLFRAFGVSCGLAVLTWAMYLALEPYARRYWAESLISWARMLSGRLRDPRVGRDLLIGATAGAALLCVPYAPWGSPPDDFSPPVSAMIGRVDILLGGRYLLGELSDIIISALPAACGLLLLLLVFRLVFRQTLLAAAAFALFYVALVTLMFGSLTVPGVVTGLVMGAAFSFIVVRFGFLAVIAMIVAWDGIERFASALDFGQWYAGQLWIGPLFVFALALYGFWTSLAGRPLFKDSLAA